MSEFLGIDEILSANWQSCDPMEMQRLAMRAKGILSSAKARNVAAHGLYQGWNTSLYSTLTHQTMNKIAPGSSSEM